MEELLASIDAQINTFKVESEKGEKGNASAKKRARKASLDLGKLFKEYRAKSI
jgi:hypothetical protein